MQKVELDNKAALAGKVAAARRVLPQEQDDNVEKGAKRRSSMLEPEMTEGNLELKDSKPMNTLEVLKAQNIA